MHIHHGRMPHPELERFTTQLVEDLRRRLAAKERVAVVGGNTKCSSVETN